MLNGLDLFSGIGGIGLALAPWSRTVAYCEINKYAQSVLLARMAEGLLDNAPIWDDITTLEKSMLPPIDLVYGGFPCQDISVAGLGAGLEGKRSELFFEILRLAKEIKPSFIFLENVPAITSRGGVEVVSKITEMGYDCRWTCLSAAEVGANHKRERWFLLANTRCESKRPNENLRSESEKSIRENASKLCSNVPNPDGLRELQQEKIEPEFRGRSSDICSEVSDSLREGLEGQREESIKFYQKQQNTFNRSWWTVEPDVGRVAHGVQFRMDRIKCLGNSVVPSCAREAFKELMGLK